MNFKDVLKKTVLKKIVYKGGNIICRPFRDFYINLSLGMHCFLVLLVFLSFFYYLHSVSILELKPELLLKEENNNLIIVLDSVEIADFNNLQIKKTDFDSGTKEVEKKFSTIVIPPVIEEAKKVPIEQETIKEIKKNIREIKEVRKQSVVKTPVPIAVKEEFSEESIKKEELKEIIKIIEEKIKEPISEIIKEIKEVKTRPATPAVTPRPAPKVTPSSPATPAPKLKPAPPLAFKKIESAELKEDDELASLFKSMELQATSGSVNKTGGKDGIIGKGETDYDATKKIGIKYINAIRSKFTRCWNIPIGGAYIEDLTVIIQVELDIEGDVIQAVILPRPNINTNERETNNSPNDGYYQVFAESALRAVYLCSPMKNLPKDQFSNWNKLELTFNAKDAL